MEPRELTNITPYHLLTGNYFFKVIKNYIFLATNFQIEINKLLLMKRIFANTINLCMIITIAAAFSACNGETKSPETKPDTQPKVTASAPEAKLNINTASDEAFRTIPGVGDKMVHEFNEYQPYVSIREFRKEIGKYVDEAQVAEYEKYIYIPISYNTSDAETLMQIPGLDTAEADSLIAKRPFESKEAFIEALSSVVGEPQLKVAKSYLENE